MYGIAQAFLMVQKHDTHTTHRAVAWRFPNHSLTTDVATHQSNVWCFAATHWLNKIFGIKKGNCLERTCPPQPPPPLHPQNIWFIPKKSKKSQQKVKKVVDSKRLFLRRHQIVCNYSFLRRVKNSQQLFQLFFDSFWLFWRHFTNLSLFTSCEVYSSQLVRLASANFTSISNYHLDFSSNWQLPFRFFDQLASAIFFKIGNYHCDFSIYWQVPFRFCDLLASAISIFLINRQVPSYAFNLFFLFLLAIAISIFRSIGSYHFNFLFDGKSHFFSKGNSHYFLLLATQFFLFSPQKEIQ